MIRQFAIGRIYSHADYNVLFDPSIMTLRCPLYDVDLMFHKTNSSYFADLDEARLRVLARVFPECFAMFHSNKPLLVLGSTACVFFKSILPMQPYELHTQILCWDQKWLYIATYFLVSGGSKKLLYTRDTGGDIEEVKKKIVLAAAVTKYCFKKGRLTVKPDDYLREKNIINAQTEPEIKERINLEMRIADAMSDLSNLRESLKWL